MSETIRVVIKFNPAEGVSVESPAPIGVTMSILQAAETAILVDMVRAALVPQRRVIGVDGLNLPPFGQRNEG